MKVGIRFARKTDLPQYTSLLQKSYQDAYTDESIGLAKERFSVEVFNSSNNQEYLIHNLEVNANQKTWLSFIGNELVGSITVERKDNECDLRGFYVLKDYQGQGIGKKLWKKARDFSKSDDVVLDIYAHNKKSIEMYKKWGFTIDDSKGIFYLHWPEWPEGLKAACISMRYKAK